MASDGDEPTQPDDQAGESATGSVDSSSDESTEAEDETARLDAYDLDEDGKISVVEAERARLGIVDARMEELSHQPGIKGRLADSAHKLLDKIDND